MVNRECPNCGRSDEVPVVRDKPPAVKCDYCGIVFDGVRYWELSR